MLLGLPGDNTYANYREANRALWRLTLLPLLSKLLKGLQAGMADWFDTAPSVDLDRVPALAEDREKLWSQISSADFLDPQEKREMLGLPREQERLEGGDVLIVRAPAAALVRLTESMGIVIKHGRHPDDAALHSIESGQPSRFASVPEKK